MPEKFLMDKGHFAIKIGALNIADQDMTFEKQDDNSVLLTIKLTILPDQIAEDSNTPTVINPDFIPCGVFAFNGNGLRPIIFPAPVVEKNVGTNYVMFTSASNAIFTLGEKREHASTLHQNVTHAKR